MPDYRLQSVSTNLQTRGVADLNSYECAPFHNAAVSNTNQELETNSSKVIVGGIFGSLVGAATATTSLLLGTSGVLAAPVALPIGLLGSALCGFGLVVALENYGMRVAAKASVAALAALDLKTSQNYEILVAIKASVAELAELAALDLKTSQAKEDRASVRTLEWDDFPAADQGKAPLAESEVTADFHSADDSFSDSFCIDFSDLNDLDHWAADTGIAAAKEEAAETEEGNKPSA